MKCPDGSACEHKCVVGDAPHGCFRAMSEQYPIKTFDECKRLLILPWVGNVPLMGSDVPEDNGMIEHLIRYLVTVRERFGNTRVAHDISLQWGATALHKCDEQAARIKELERQVQTLEGDVSDLLERNKAQAVRIIDLDGHRQGGLAP